MLSHLHILAQIHTVQPDSFSTDYAISTVGAGRWRFLKSVSIDLIVLFPDHTQPFGSNDEQKKRFYCTIWNVLHLFNKCT